MSCKCVVMLVCRVSVSCDIRESFRYVVYYRQVVQLRVLGCEYAEGNTENRSGQDARRIYQKRDWSDTKSRDCDP
jgi:hypothetical protein